MKKHSADDVMFSSADIAFILSIPTGTVAQLTAKGILQADEHGKYSLMPTVRAWVNYWGKLDERITNLIRRAGGEENAIVSAAELSDYFELTIDEVQGYAHAGVFIADENGRFELKQALNEFMRVCKGSIGQFDA